MQTRISYDGGLTWVGENVGSGSFDDLTIVQSGDDTVITYDGGSITLEGIQASQITEADFDFIG